MISCKAIISANVRYHHKSEDSVGTQESGERERDMTSHRPQLMASLSRLPSASPAGAGGRAFRDLTFCAQNNN